MCVLLASVRRRGCGPRGRRCYPGPAPRMHAGHATFTRTPPTRAPRNVQPTMIDLHCHVLPGIDDGPATIEASVALARAAAAAGAQTIVATPHVSWDYPNDAATIARLVDTVNERLAQEQIDVTVRAGAELAFTRIADIPEAELGAARPRRQPLAARRATLHALGDRPGERDRRPARARLRGGARPPRALPRLPPRRRHARAPDRLGRGLLDHRGLARRPLRPGGASLLAVARARPGSCTTSPPTRTMPFAGHRAWPRSSRRRVWAGCGRGRPRRCRGRSLPASRCRRARQRPRWRPRAGAGRAGCAGADRTSGAPGFGRGAAGRGREARAASGAGAWQRLPAARRSGELDDRDDHADHDDDDDRALHPQPEGVHARRSLEQARTRDRGVR